MPLANPAAKFNRASVCLRLTVKPYERRSVCVQSASAGYDHRPGYVSKCNGGHTHFTRARVVEAVERGEMVWMDRHHNTAAFTPKAAGTWQKVQSGPVATMQLVVGGRGRYVPAFQRDVDMESLLAVSAMG